MASLSYPKTRFGRLLAGRFFAICLGAVAVLSAPAIAEAACVAAAINGGGKQIRGTRSITHGVFPRKVCRRALRHCERRLDEIRYDTGRRRPHARCEIIASGPRAAEIFGPPLEGWRVDPDGRDRRYSEPAYRDRDEGDYAYRGDDRRYEPTPRRFDEPGAHDGWRSTDRDRGYNDERYADRRYEDPTYRAPPAVEERDYRGGDPLIDDLLRDDPAAPPPSGSYSPYEDDRAASGCNVDACAARYKTFRASDCSYKPSVDERRRCPL